MSVLDALYFTVETIGTYHLHDVAHHLWERTEAAHGVVGVALADRLLLFGEPEAAHSPLRNRAGSTRARPRASRSR